MYRKRLRNHLLNLMVLAKFKVKKRIEPLNISLDTFKLDYQPLATEKDMIRMALDARKKERGRKHVQTESPTKVAKDKRGEQVVLRRTVIGAGRVHTSVRS